MKVGDLIRIKNWKELRAVQLRRDEAAAGLGIVTRIQVEQQPRLVWVWWHGSTKETLENEKYLEVINESQ